MAIKNRKLPNSSQQPGGQKTLRGKVSWFGGPHDSSDSGSTALGLTTATPGIAVYDQETLGGYWYVTFPNGRSQLYRQTDIGPAPWTGRVVDVTYSGLSAAGYSESTFPTDAMVTAVYLGKDKQTATLQAGGSPVAQVVQDATGTPQNTGMQTAAFGLPGIPSPGQAIADAGTVLDILKDIATLNMGDLASKFALLTLRFVRETFVGFADLVIAPAWHWNQRTVAYYNKTVLDPRNVAGGGGYQWAFAWTAVFWASGYVLLYTEPDGDKALAPVPATRSRLGHHVRRLQAAPARRSLIKPRDVKQHTPKKPKPRVSIAQVNRVQTMSTERNRSVTVNAHRGSQTRGESPQRGTVSEVPIRRDATEPATGGARDPRKPKPNADHTTGQGTLRGSTRPTESPTRPRGTKRD